MSLDTLERPMLQDELFEQSQEFSEVVERLAEPPEATRARRRAEAIETLLADKETTVARQIQGVISFYAGRRVGAVDYTSNDVRDFTGVVTRGTDPDSVAEAYSAYAVCGPGKRSWSETYYAVDMFLGDQQVRIIAAPNGRTDAYDVQVQRKNEKGFAEVEESTEQDALLRDFFGRSLHAAEQHFSRTDEEQAVSNGKARALAETFFRVSSHETSLE